jgi:hypothetical protein
MLPLFPRRNLKSIENRAQRLKIRKPSPRPERFERLDVDRDFLLWLAGFVDGEGTIALYPTYKQGTVRPYSVFMPRFAIANTNYEMLVKIQSKIGGGIRTNHNVGPTSKVCHQLQINGHAKVVPVLLALRPYLKMKQTQCDLVLEHSYAWLASPRRSPVLVADGIYASLKLLNRKGPALSGLPNAL